MIMKANPLASLDRERIEAELDKEGYALLPGLVDPEQVVSLAAKVISQRKRAHRLEDAALGRGLSWRPSGELQSPLETWRHALYEMLAPLANRWNEVMGLTPSFPAQFENYLARDHGHGGRRSNVELTQLCQDDYQALHQSADGEHGFPVQLVLLLSEPGVAFTGGEFVMTEQRPRMQSRPMVLPMGSGDAALITVARRPFKGSKGYYRVNMKHAISRVRSGERLGLELLFHDAPEDDGDG
jgi:hypothetical protein